MDTEPLIKTTGLTRYFGRLAAVQQVDLAVRRGEILGLLGVNGAGKSTTMDMLCGVLAPSAGRVAIGGFDLAAQPRQAKRLIGYLPEHTPVYAELTVSEYLHFCARLRGLGRRASAGACETVLDKCDLQAVSKRLIGNLSKGYQQRLGLAQAFVHDPSVIVLDEPTAGLDPVQLQRIRDLIVELAESCAVVLSTHILPEVTAVCDRVMILHDGKVVHEGLVSALTRAAHRLTLRCARPLDTAALGAIAGVTGVTLSADGRATLDFEAHTNPAPAVARLAVEHDWELLELNAGQSSLEQTFVELTYGTAVDRTTSA
ncbi:MAG: ABC transporter ATP-binding protein [Gammaproteobacteria bacterium]|nr:ABC transporter ATP-binding protein [Gammaproteobacteria bacterium]